MWCWFFVAGVQMRKVGKESHIKENARWMNLLENIFMVVLVFYPLRHIGVGIDLQDTGYNYANFQYMGTEHMDPMWLFSTYLANVVGNFLTRLPNGDTLMGMNLYTGLFVSVLALAGYFFCTRKLKMPKVLTFVGELMAISLCWCPTALLYNYLTYLFFLGSFILLYCGLTMEPLSFGAAGDAMEDKTLGEKSSTEKQLPIEVRYFMEKQRSKKQKFFLAGAGALLGVNVLVRFSNLPEAAMIVAVWAYDVILWLEERKIGAAQREGFWHRLARHTFWCLLGYVAALLLFLGDIHIRYGLGEYAAGIRRLFAMTENASDYKATSMLMGIIRDYVENLYWVIRIGIIVVGGLALFAISGWLERMLRRRGGKNPSLLNMVAMIHIGVRVLWAAVSVVMLVWLYGRKFCSLLFYSYDPIRRPCILFLMLTMVIGVIRIFHRDSPREEKLLSGMLILVILLTSIGSNNRTFPSWNNLFVAAPYTLWESWQFVCRRKGSRIFVREFWNCWKKGDFCEGGLLFPVKAVLLTFLGMCFFQSAGFGASFVFAEGTGVQEPTAYVENNAVLKNIRMNPERAQWVTELSAYVDENGLQGSEVILYGGIPALSYYLQMPSAFNPWMDLLSYNLTAMEKDMAKLEDEITQMRAKKPVIILEEKYACYKESGANTQAAEIEKKIGEDKKWKLLADFMEKYGYGQVFHNGKFAIYR